MSDGLLVLFTNQVSISSVRFPTFRLATLRIAFSMSTMSSRINENYHRVLEQIAAACRRSNRPVSSVTLVAVTKYAQLDWVRELRHLGSSDLGESRPQQLAERSSSLGPGIHWHLIGHLQRNKVRPILPLVSLIHSVDSLRLLTRIDQLAAEMQLRPRALLQVNVSGESTKDGFTMAELRTAWPTVLSCSHVQVAGLMTMAPHTDQLDVPRTVFRDLRNFRDELLQQSPDNITLPHLSMGMSNDFTVAIEEGATLVRIGSTLFDGLSS